MGRVYSLATVLNADDEDLPQRLERLLERTPCEILIVGNNLSHSQIARVKALVQGQPHVAIMDYPTRRALASGVLFAALAARSPQPVFAFAHGVPQVTIDDSVIETAAAQGFCSVDRTGAVSQNVVSTINAIRPDYWRRILAEHTGALPMLAYGSVLTAAATP